MIFTFTNFEAHCYCLADNNNKTYYVGNIIGKSPVLLIL
jgi:hypothetical protein